MRQKHDTPHESTASTKGTPALCEHPAARLWPRAGRGRGSGLQGNRERAQGANRARGFRRPPRRFHGPGKGEPALGGARDLSQVRERSGAALRQLPVLVRGGTGFGWLLPGRGDTSDACETRPLVLRWPRPSPALQQERRRRLGPSGGRGLEETRALWFIRRDQASARRPLVTQPRAQAERRGREPPPPRGDIQAACAGGGTRLLTLQLEEASLHRNTSHVQGSRAGRSPRVLGTVRGAGGTPSGWWGRRG